MSGDTLLARACAVCALVMMLGVGTLGPGTGTAQAAEPRYWPAGQLEVRPQVKTHVMPEYPPELVSGTRGRVVLELFIGADGAVDRVRVVRAEPVGRFEQAATKAFAAARFAPGMRKGKAVPSLLRVEVTFGD